MGTNTRGNGDGWIEKTLMICWRAIDEATELPGEMISVEKMGDGERYGRKVVEKKKKRMKMKL